MGLHNRNGYHMQLNRHICFGEKHYKLNEYKTLYCRFLWHFKRCNFESGNIDLSVPYRNNSGLKYIYNYSISSPPPPPPPLGRKGSVLPLSLKIMNCSTQILENNFLCSLKVFPFAPQIPKNSSASPQIPKNICQLSLKCIFRSVGLKSHTYKTMKLYKSA